LVLALIGLIAAGALYVLSGGQRADAEPFSVTTTLKELTSRVMPASGGGEVGVEPSGDEEANGLGLARWFGRDKAEADESAKDVYYQYVDDTGTVHFVQNLGDIPAKWQSKAGRVELEQTALVDGGTRPAAPRRAVRNPAERPFAYRPDPEVVVYTTAWCGWCRKTLQYLDERNVRYVNKDIEANDWNRQELIEKTGRTSIPVVEIDGELIRGYSEARMDELLSR
jgi:glutaredoxin 3